MSLRSNANKKQFPDCIPGGAQCNSGELVDEGACRNPLTTDVNTNCDATAYIAGNTDGSACRLPLTTDVNAN
ncbi:MAG: hypothetical protein HRU36_05470, partial [Rickettsiales bacterium]|nr:hypothetical protein [Rickettsiales bacterium]